MLDFKRLQCFDAVYRHRNFTRASEELYVSQSAISIAIKTLEQELGVKLVVRTPQDVSFTHEGERFILYCRRILRECENAEKEMADLSKTKNSTLHLGISPVLGIRLQRFLHSPDFYARFPSASVYLEEASMNIQIEKIRQGLLDLSYNGLPKQADASGLELIPVTTAQIYVIMQPNHPFANYHTIPVSALDGMDVIMLNEKSLVHSLLMAEFDRAGIVPNIRSSHEQIFNMINTIKFGNFLGFMSASDPYIVETLNRNGLILREMENPIIFQVGFILKEGRYLPTIARDLIAIAKELERDN